MAPDRRSASSAHNRIDDLLLQLTQHTASCSIEMRQLNARMRRVEMILLASTGAILLLLLSLVLR